MIDFARETCLITSTELNILFSEMPEGQGILFDRFLSECHLRIVKLDTEKMVKMNCDVDTFHVVALTMRSGVTEYFHELEHGHFPLNTPLNDEFKWSAFKWQDLMWSIASIPLSKKDAAYKAAAKTNMRIANGYPHAVKQKTSNRISGLASVRYFPTDFAQQLGLGNDIDMVRFPLNSDRVFSLENKHEAPGPVVQVYSEKTPQ